MSLSRRRLARAGLPVALATAAALAVGAPAAGAPNFPESVPLPAGSQPEGIAAGPGTSFFAGARADGAIYRGDLRTGEGVVLVPGVPPQPGVPGRVAVGMQYDSSSGLLWVAGGRTGAITAYDGRTGAEVYRRVLTGTRFLNDLVVTREAVHVTDSLNAELVVVPLERGGRTAGEPRPLPLTGDFRLAPGNNANGIRELAGGDLVVVQGNLGTLFRVDPDTGVATEIVQTGTRLTGGDGLERRGSTLYVVNGFADAVALLDLRGDTASLTGTVTDSTLDRPTTGALTAGRLWVVNGRFSTPPTPTTPYSVSQLPAR